MIVPGSPDRATRRGQPVATALWPVLRRTIAQNFVKRYGQQRFRELLDALGSGQSGQSIAEAFDVSRERVRQWKNTFGTVVTLYQVHPEILSVFDEPRSRADE